MSYGRYDNAAYRVREYQTQKLKSEMNKNVTDNGLRLVKLTTLIPNWQTYLTEKQLQAMEKYLVCFNAYEVDHQLKIKSGNSYQRLFGSSTNKGALGRLEEIYKRLEDNGFFIEQKQQKELAKEEKTTNIHQLSIVKVRELVQLILGMPRYDQYLTPQQDLNVELFMKYKNFKDPAKELKVSTAKYQSSLIGKNGVLDILKKAQEERTIDSWDDV